MAAMCPGLTNRSASVSGESNKKMKSVRGRRQSAPSLVITKALSKSRSRSRESCVIPISAESCSLVKSFLCTSRVFLSHNAVRLQTGLQTQERHLFLFTDILLIAKAKSASHYKLKARVRVGDMWTAGCTDEVCEGSISSDCSFVMGWPTCNCVATFSCVELKEKWLQSLQSRIREEKEKDQPKIIPLKIFSKDMGSCVYSKVLSVINTDTVNDVIHLATQQFGITASVRDYQLWVSSSKDAAPYPLIGHEFPYSIQTSHIRDSNSSASELLSPLSLQWLSDSHCRFILKPRGCVTDSAHKHFKRKHSLLNWTFWRSSSPQLDFLPPSVPSTARLFGLPLSSLCHNNVLPKPVMDMLDVLFHQAPYTRGIFRRSASAKACRELRERLNAGIEDVPLANEPIFVIAAVFKEFLRNIPGSLLSQDLYEDWLGVLHQPAEGEDRVQAMCRMVQKMPAENRLLLRHTLTMLHCVDQHSHHNQMNAFNLSVCIAPSMLWAPSTKSSQLDGEATWKIAEVVRFLIENCGTVLGEDISAAFGEFLQKRASSDHGSDVSFHMNDSSYDSLENDLNRDTESPPQVLRCCRHRRDNWSRDSVITLSDCDLDQLDPPREPKPERLQPAPAFRCRKLSPAARRSRPPPAWDSPCPLGSRRLRRCSEPAIVHMPPELESLQLHDSYPAAASAKGEGCVEQVAGLQVEPNVPRRQKLPPPAPLHLDASCSSLSSPATSPSTSSVSSLDSAFSQYSIDYASATPAESSPTPPGHASLPLPKDPAYWSQHRSTHGLHPNTWLKKEQRLSLLQPDNSSHEGPGTAVALMGQDCHSTAGKSVGLLFKRRSSCPPSYQQALLQLPQPKALFYTSQEKGLTLKELRQLHQKGSTIPSNARQSSSHLPQDLFYTHSSTSLSLRPSKRAQSLQHKSDFPRRASEPAVSHVGGPQRNKESQDKGLRVSEVDPQPGFCLSPSAARALRDYVSSHTDQSRSQEVAHAVGQSKREQHSPVCSDPRFDDFDQLLFAEESYV